LFFRVKEYRIQEQPGKQDTATDRNTGYRNSQEHRIQEQPGIQDTGTARNIGYRKTGYSNTRIDCRNMSSCILT
jgi:hypothetical protein